MAEKTLNLAQCKEYMKNVMDLEVSCYEQEKMLTVLKNRPSTIKREITSLQNEIDKAPPTRPLPVVVSILGSVIGSVFLCAFIALVGALVGAGVGLISLLVFHTNDWTGRVLLLTIIGFGVVFVPTVIYSIVSSTASSIDEKDLFPYELEQFKKKKAENIAKCDKKRELLNQIVKVEIGNADSKLQETKELLKQCYDLGFIYPKYRNLVAVATMYEYLDSGRCFSLIGPGGAYNLYESELRMNTIISKLDDVIDRLDDLAEGQRMLAQAIRQSNEKIDNLTRAMDNIESNTAVTAYYSEITAQNSTIDLWYKILND